MHQPLPDDPRRVATAFHAEVQALPLINTPDERRIRRRYSRMLKQAPAPFAIDFVQELVDGYGYRGMAYEFIASHRAAMDSIDEATVERLGRGLHSWGSVDGFARILAGPAWVKGQLSNELIHRWARSPDRWWRRAAVVSTVAWNVRSKGGPGDVERTLAVCRLLVADPDDMGYKAISWALRELAVHNPDALRDFLQENDDGLAARVKREVRNKLETGLKNP